MLSDGGTFRTKKELANLIKNNPRINLKENFPITNISELYNLVSKQDINKSRNNLDKATNLKLAKLFAISGESKYESGDINGGYQDYIRATHLKEKIGEYDYEDDIFPQVLLENLKYKISEALELNPKNEEAFFYRGLLRFRSNDYDDAIEDFSKVIELNPKNEEAFLYRGRSKDNLKTDKNKFDIEDYSKVISSKEKTDFNRYYAKSNSKNIKEVKEFFKNGIDDYSQVIKLNPENEEAFFERGSSKFEFKNYKAAIRDFSQVVKLNPSFWDAFMARSAARLCIRDFEGAISDYFEALKVNPKIKIEYYEFNEFFNKINDKNIDQKIKKKMERVLFGIGFMKYRIGEYQQSIFCYSKALVLNPRNVKALINRGLSK